MVIVKSKLTGKFLHNHSGSANARSRAIRWQVIKDKKFLATLPLPTKDEKDYGWYGPRGESTERQKLISREVHNRLYSAEPVEARRYASYQSALTSIGKWNVRKLGNPKKKDPVFHLPEHLEIHEIIGGDVILGRRR